MLAVLPRPGGPLRDRELRRALSRAIDRTALARTFEPRKAVPTGRFLTSRQRGFDPTLEEPRFDLAPLREAVARTRDGLPELVIGYSSGARVLAPGLVQALADQGLRVRAEEVLVTSLDGVQGAGYDALLYVVNTVDVRGEPWNLIRLLAEGNRKVDEEPSVHAAFERLLVERERPAREKLYAQLERGFLESAAVIPLARLPLDTPRAAHAFLVYRDRVRGLADPDTHLLLGAGRTPAAAMTGVWLER